MDLLCASNWLLFSCLCMFVLLFGALRGTYLPLSFFVSFPCFTILFFPFAKISEVASKNLFMKKFPCYSHSAAGEIFNYFTLSDALSVLCIN